jgi:hypothetical protein
MWNQVRQALADSLARVIMRIADLLPGILALIVALLVSIILAGIVAFLLKRSLRSFDFDERLARWGMSGLTDWSPSNSPSLLVVRVVYWTMILMGFLVGVAAFNATLTSQLVIHLFGYLPNVIAAVLLLVFGNILARFLARSVLIGAVNMNVPYAHLLSAGVKWLVLVLTVAMALDHLSIGGGIVHLAFGILFGGIVLALALAVGLGSKDLVSRSLDRASRKTDKVEEPLRHL